MAIHSSFRQISKRGQGQGHGHGVRKFHGVEANFVDIELLKLKLDWE